MNVTWIVLAVLAVTLAWPVPIVFARAAWPDRAPGTALVLWQAIALAGGLSMIGALLSYGLQPFGDTLVAGLRALPHYLVAGRLPEQVDFSQMFALTGAILLTVHLILNLALTVVRSERSRVRHRQLVTLLSTPIPERPGLRLIDYEAPVAYCLPGTTRSVTVLSAGLVELLDESQLAAVISHENAHATQRHHLVLLVFRAWRASLPWFPIATRALVAVTTLVEMLADDRARRDVSNDTLARSIALVAAASDSSRVGKVGALSNALAATDDSATEPIAGSAEDQSAERRITRLLGSLPPLPTGIRSLAVITAVALLAVPTAIVLSPVFA